jgi:hypothetical protein
MVSGGLEEIDTDTHSIARQVKPTAGLDAVEKRKISLVGGIENQVVQPVD